MRFLVAALLLVLVAAADARTVVVREHLGSTGLDPGSATVGDLRAELRP